MTPETPVERRLREMAPETIKLVLDAVDVEIGRHLYTNTKNGHREAMFNITKRLRERFVARCGGQEGTSR